MFSKLIRRLLTPVLWAPALAIIAVPGAFDARAQDYGGYESYDDYEPYDPIADGEDDYEDGREVPDVTYFYDELGDDGRWLTHPTYGRVWTPYGVSRDWRPYTRGRWANTAEHGWYWVSDEPFGWATYHYGRWYRDSRHGWVWVPGTRWGPAWVAWRSNDDYIGWAPLPPDAYWQPSRGLVYSRAIYESPAFSIYWSFARPAYITSPTLVRYYVPRRDVTRIIYRTRPRTTYRFVNRRIVNRGVSVTTIERVTRKRVKIVRVRATDNRTVRRTRIVKKNEITVFRPKLTRYKASRDRKKGRPAINRTLWKDVDKRKVKVRKTKASRKSTKTPKLPNNPLMRPDPPRKVPGAASRTIGNGQDIKPNKKKKKKKARRSTDDPIFKKKKKGKKARNNAPLAQGEDPQDDEAVVKKKKKKKKKNKNKKKNENTD